MSDKPKWWPECPYAYDEKAIRIYGKASNTIWEAMKKNMGGDELMMATLLEAIDEALDGKEPMDFLMSFPIVRKAYETSEAACG